MDRHYKAFISYRHLPLEMDVAKKLHRRIERFLIPRTLRRNGEKHPGTVFRDQDELPIASDLSANIRLALDASEFLIVICTPETRKSRWVLEEIHYFLEHHDRDHVLAVLADGEPEQAFPPELTELRSEGGDLLDRVEPLAANIVAGSRGKRDRLLQVESLRILAALIGCPFDALYRRQQRYRRRRAALALGTAALVALGFIGLLLNRNAEIRRQLELSRYNESRALAALSESAFEDGDYRGAIENALAALPSEEDDRPYVPRAEYVLADELYPYSDGIFAFCGSLQQDTAISRVAVSPDGAYAATVDRHYVLRLFRTRTGEKLWERELYLSPQICFPEGPEAVLAADLKSVSLISCPDGAELWRREGARLRAVSADGKTVLISDEEDALLLLLDLETGRTLHQIRREDGLPDLQYAALDRSGSLAAVLCEGYGYGEEAGARLFLWETEGDRILELDALKSASMLSDVYALTFSDSGDLLLGYDYLGGEAYVKHYDRSSGWEESYRTALVRETDPSFGKGLFYTASIELFAARSGHIAFGSRQNLFILEESSGQVLAHVQLPDALCAGRMYRNGSMSLLLANGVVTACTGEGLLSYQYDMYGLACDFPLSLGEISGQKHREAVFALVPYKHKNRVTLVRELDNPRLRPIFEADSVIRGSRLFASPSGQVLVCLYRDYDEKVYRGVWLDRRTGEGARPFRIPAVEGLYYDNNEVFVTDQGQIIIQGALFDLNSQESRILKENEQDERMKARSCWDGENGRLVTAAFGGSGGGEAQALKLWIDGDFYRRVQAPAPAASSGYRSRSVLGLSPDFVLAGLDDGERSYAAYCISEDCWYPLPLTEIPEARALAETGPWLALAEEGQIRLTDLRGSGTERTLSCGVPLQVIKRLQFAQGDSLLFVLGETGEMEILDVETGQILHHSDYGERNLGFAAGDRLSVFALPGDRLMLIADGIYTEAVCILVETDTWESVGFYSGPTWYFPESNELVVKPYLEGVSLTELLDTRGLMALGEQILGGGTE